MVIFHLYVLQMRGMAFGISLRMKTIKHLSSSERKHYLKCSCGDYFDMRDLQEVVNHLHLLKNIEAGYSHSVRLDEPVAYSKKKRKIGLN